MNLEFLLYLSKGATRCRFLFLVYVCRHGHALCGVPMHPKKKLMAVYAMSHRLDFRFLSRGDRKLQIVTTLCVNRAHGQNNKRIGNRKKKKAKHITFPSPQKIQHVINVSSISCWNLYPFRSWSKALVGSKLHEAARFVMGLVLEKKDRPGQSGKGSLLVKQKSLGKVLSKTTFSLSKSYPSLIIKKNATPPFLKKKMSHPLRSADLEKMTHVVPFFVFFWLPTVTRERIFGPTHTHT